jgi:hypothetical protein
MGMIDVELYLDHVIILGIRVDRPSRISRTAWEKYWQTWHCAKCGKNVRY